jgi:hypothetical protein
MEIKLISLFLIVFITIVITWGIIKIHTYPEKIAKLKNHPQEKAISITALLGLLIFPLWMLALVWAYSNATIGSLYNKGDSDTNSPDIITESKKHTDKSGESEKKKPKLNS